MFSRRNSSSSVSMFQRSSSVRRRKSAIIDTNTNSELCNSQEASRQAIAAAQRAFVSSQYKPSETRQSKQPTPAPAPLRTGLSEIDPNQPRTTFSRPPKLRFSRNGAPPGSVTSQDYGADSIYSEITPPRNAIGQFDSHYYDTVEDDETVIHRQSPLPYGSGSYPARIFREPSYETLVTAPRDIGVDAFSDRTPTASPNPISSAPSSFKRLERSKSMMAMSISHHFREGHSTEIKPAYTSATGRRLEQRKSTSFLRGGTNFMPQSMKQQQFEAKPRERMSFYTPSSARPMRESILFQEAMEGYRGRNERGEWGALRWVVKRKARRITQVFGSVKNIFGKRKGDRSPGSALNIPEQHIFSTKPHFGDYAPSMTQNSRATFESSIAPRPIPMGPREKPKIRSSYVVSKMPVKLSGQHGRPFADGTQSLHDVPSYERIRSDVRSISEVHMVTPEREACQPVVAHNPYETVSTWSSFNWDSTVASQRPDFSDTACTDSIIGRDTSTPTPGKSHGSLFIPPRPQRRDRINVDVRRLYSALVKKMDDSPPQLKPIPVRESCIEADVEETTPESSIHSELARALEFRRSALTTSTSRHVSTGSVRSRVASNGPPGRSPPPIPEVPKIRCNADVPGDMERGSSDECPAPVSMGSATSSAKREARRHKPIHAVTIMNAQSRSAGRRKREVSFAGSSTSHRTATSGVNDKPEAHSNVGVDEDARLLHWNLQMMKQRDTSASTDLGIQIWPRQQRIPSIASRKENTPPPAPYHLVSCLRPTQVDVNRPRSAAAYRQKNTSTPVRRTATAMGHTDTPIRTGLMGRDVNLPSTAYARRQTSLERTASRTSLCGRQSRASMENFDVGEAVRRQFGPVAGDEDMYEHNDLSNWYCGSFV